MIRIPLSGDDDFLLLAPRWSTLAPAWQVSLLSLLLLAPVALILWLYRYEMRLVSRGAALVLLGLRLILLLLFWIVVAWQPVVLQEPQPRPEPEPEESPSRILIAVDRSPSMDVVDSQRSAPEKESLADALRLPRTIDIDALTRLDTARAILASPGLNLPGLLKKHHEVEFLGFHQTTWDADGLDDLFRRQDSKNQSTDLRQPLMKALERAATERGTLTAVVLLSDGQHNAGPSPLAKAAELGQRSIPIYAVALGTRRPPADIAFLEVKAPSNVFKDVDVPVEARVKVSGMAKQEIAVELFQPGTKEPLVHKIAHDGVDRIYTIPLRTKYAEPGTHTLKVKVRPSDPRTREVTRDNNERSVVVRVAQEKARILLVDGEARWEYHFLANALMRDKSMMTDRVVFEQPRLKLKELPEDKLEKLGNPSLHLPKVKDGDDPLARYDCIILGDVLPEQLPPADRKRLEHYVGERGGTLVLVAGKRAMPLEYLQKDPDDPLVRLLPLRAISAQDPRAKLVNPREFRSDKGFPVTLSREGMDTPFLQLEATRDENGERWAKLPHHYWGVVGRAKPGAESLAYLAEESSPPSLEEKKEPLERRQGLLVRQNYGAGRVLFVGIDSTWRWRYREGDTYHHRFWSGVVRWATADRLLPAGNKFVRFGSRLPVYRHAKDVEIAVRLADEVPVLAATASAHARVFRAGKDKPIARIPLTPTAGYPRLLEGKASGLTPGEYRIELDIPDLKSQIEAPPDPEDIKNVQRNAFTVLPAENAEMLDLSTNFPLLESLAAQSKGEVFTPENVLQLLDRLAEKRAARLKRPDPPGTESDDSAAAYLAGVPRHLQQRLWQDPPLVWWLLGAFLTVLTAEWVLRKWAGLP